jgi:hypothetical protein
MVIEGSQFFNEAAADARKLHLIATIYISILHYSKERLLVQKRHFMNRGRYTIHIHTYLLEFELKEEAGS